MTHEPKGKTSLLMERFLTMLRDYNEQVERAQALLCQFLPIAPVLGWFSLGAASPKIPQSGYCDPQQEIFYFFHGFGCEVKTEGLWVDWDYDSGGRLGGFDLIRLQFFVERCCDRYPELKDRTILHAIFERAIEQGRIHQPYELSWGNLYYLAETAPEGDTI